MSNEKYTLKSGVVLQVTMAAFEIAIALKEAVDDVMLSIDSSWDENDPRVGYKLLANIRVREALFPCFDTCLYGTERVTRGLFDDAKLGVKARGDYHEMAAYVIKVNRGPFFLTNSSVSSTLPETPSKSHESP